MKARRFLPGELVLTPLRRPARVVKVRRDGLVDLQYVAETVTLRWELLERAENEDEGTAA